MAKKKSIDELLEQKAQIENEIASLERQRAIASLAKEPEVRAVAKQAAKLELTDEEILALVRGTVNASSGTKPRKGRTRRATATKKSTPSIPVATYQHPTDPNVTWSGRGRKPGWIVEWVESGKPVEELRKE